MSSLSQNIGQAINDFDNIKSAIESKGVDVGNAKTSEYANKISQIKTGQEIFFSTDGRCYISELVLPNSVKSIGDNAFLGCSSLTSIAIPNSVTSIGHSAFRGCSSLTSVAIPNSVTSIGNQAFAYCTSLTSITIPNSVTSISYTVFQMSSNLSDIRLGTGFNSPLTLSDWWGTIQLTANVMVAMFEALADLTGQDTKTLKLGAKNQAKLTAEQKQIATNKNWNLA